MTQKKKLLPAKLVDCNLRPTSIARQKYGLSYQMTSIMGPTLLGHYYVLLGIPLPFVPQTIGHIQLDSESFLSLFFL